MPRRSPRVTVTFRRKGGQTRGFRLEGHTDKLICAVISAYTMNAVNAIEVLTNAEFTLDAEEAGGFMDFTLIRWDERALLLLDALVIGVETLRGQYCDKISVLWEEE